MYIDFYEKSISGKGKGVFAKKFVPKGTLIWKLTEREKYTKEEYNRLSGDIKKDAYPKKNYYIRATGSGESWNHSCDANTWWTADDELSARKDIQPDEEITYDYATTDIDPSIVYNWRCKCGAKDCRKKLKWNDILNPEIYAKYEGHVPSWVEKFVKENAK